MHTDQAKYLKVNRRQAQLQPANTIPASESCWFKTNFDKNGISHEIYQHTEALLVIVKHTTRTVQETLGQLIAIYFQLLEIKKLFEK